MSHLSHLLKDQNKAFLMAFIVVHLLFAAQASAQNTIWYVDDSVSSSGTGTTNWSNAFKTLEEGLAAAGDGHTIRVAWGTYKPNDLSGTSDRNQWFTLEDGVTLEGGYEGLGGASLLTRDIAAFPTILSGDIDTSGSNDSYHVVVADDTDDFGGTILWGFTIEGGLADGDTTADGNLPAGHRNKGGGFYAFESVLNVIECTFDDNEADGRNHSGLGGGAAIAGNRSGSDTVHFLNCVFKNNTATNGGALAIIGEPEVSGDFPLTTKVSMLNCLIHDNEALKRGDPAPANEGNSAIFTLDQINLEMTNCTVSNNTAYQSKAGINIVCAEDASGGVNRDSSHFSISGK